MRMLSCAGCAMDGACSIQAAKREALRGNGITSLKFRCTQRANRFAPGDAVLVTLRTSDPDDYGDCGPVDITLERFEGYVSRVKLGRVVCFIKPGTIGDYNSAFMPANPASSGAGFVKVTIARVEHDPSRPKVSAAFCELCGSMPWIGQACQGNADFHAKFGPCPATGIPTVSGLGAMGVAP